MSEEKLKEYTEEELLVMIKNEQMEKLLRRKIDANFFQKLTIGEPNNKKYAESALNAAKLLEEQETIMRALNDIISEYRKN